MVLQDLERGEGGGERGRNGQTRTDPETRVGTEVGPWGREGVETSTRVLAELRGGDQGNPKYYHFRRVTTVRNHEVRGTKGELRRGWRHLSGKQFEDE